jgi:hypothetical protein
MAELAEIWNELLPSIREGVTGVGVWTALNLAKPLALEDGQFVLGLPHEAGELGGHLRMSLTKRLIEQSVSAKTESPVTLRVIEGTELTDWEVEKRRDAEKARLNQQQLNKMRAEMQARSSWETIYEALSRKYAAVPNKSLPQNRARFLEEAIEMIAEARRSQSTYDELGERNFARCLERLAQYSELPSTFVATQVLQRAGEL